MNKKELPFCHRADCETVKYKTAALEGDSGGGFGGYFGVTAGVSFVFVLSYKGLVVKEEDQVGGHLSQYRATRFPLITVAPTTEPVTDSSPETTEAVTTPTETTEPIEQIVESVLSERSLTLADYEALYNSMYEVVASVNRSIVTVTSAESKLDLFNQPYELKEEAAGLIYNKTDTEILILTNAESLHAADNIWVTFFKWRGMCRSFAKSRSSFRAGGACRRSRASGKRFQVNIPWQCLEILTA